MTVRRIRKACNLNVQLLIVYRGCETIIHYYVYLSLLYLHIGMYVGGFNCEVVKSKSTFIKPNHTILEGEKKIQKSFVQMEIQKTTCCLSRILFSSTQVMKRLL